MDNESSSNRKLEWMYKTGADLINREDYLTGKKVDKQIEEELSKNHVEHEIIPTSISRRQQFQGDNEQVDIIRKQMEDPLMQIRQKEIEMRKKILENPVKLKELHRLLKQEKDKKTSDSKSSAKKSKKKHKKSQRSSSSNSSSSEDKDLDQLLVEKYQKVKDKVGSDDEDGFLELRYQTLTKELDRMASKKKKKRRSESSPSSERDQKRKEPERRQRSKSNENNFRQRPRSNDRNRGNGNRQEQRFPEKRFQEQRRSRSPRMERKRSPQNRQNDFNRQQMSSRRSRSPQKSFRNRSKSPQRPFRNRSRSPTNNRNDKRRGRSPMRNPSRPNYDSRKSKSPQEKSRNKSRSPRREKDSRKRSRSPKESSRKKSRTPKPSSRTKPLTDAEMDAKRAEMVNNADWREKDRSKTVKKYRENEELEKNQHEKTFDKDFLNKHMKKAHNETASVESRIKANLNNIQRSSRTMDTNFARR
ncbi:unnamed protein product [Diamesa tonsa]